MIDRLIVWNEPYSFFRPGYQIRDEHANLEKEIEGSVGTLIGVW